YRSVAAGASPSVRFFILVPRRSVAPPTLFILLILFFSPETFIVLFFSVSNRCRLQHNRNQADPRLTPGRITSEEASKWESRKRRARRANRPVSRTSLFCRPSTLRL